MKYKLWNEFLWVDSWSKIQIDNRILISINSHCVVNDIGSNDRWINFYMIRSNIFNDTWRMLINDNK